MAGETALARQLRKLAAPQTSLLVQGKIRKSFLFDHRDAAALDRDIIFAYGTTGIEKLKLMNPMFQKFEQNLFSVNYKDFERSVQTANTNSSLDEKITEFLRILTPYFLTRAAHEALEWLIYRFHIHLFNVDALMQAAIPHCNTPSFVRVVQLLSLEEPGCRWAWLLPVLKNGVHLDYAAVVNHFIADEGFRKFICELAPNSLKVFKENHSTAAPVVSFSMLTIYYALQRVASITDQMITFLFPYIIKGLKSGMRKYIAATYLVISRIIVSVKLTEELVIQLLVRVFEDVRDDLLKEACELLILTFQQQSMVDLNKDLYKLLLSHKGCIKHLGSLSESYEAAFFSAAIIRVSVSKLFLTLSKKQEKRKSSKSKDKVNKSYKFCKRITELFFFDEKTVLMFFNSILSGYSKSYTKSKVNDQALRKVAKFLLKSLESKYPEYFDKAIKTYFKKKKGENKKHLCNLINDAVCSLKNKVLPDKQTTLVLGVHHPNSHIRTTSVKYLMEQAVSGQVSDIDFITNSLSSRLLDDSSDVVSEILSAPKVLLTYLEKKNVLADFGHILKKKVDKSSTWYPVQQTCLDILCECFSGDKELSNEIFVTLLPFIFPLQKSSIPAFHRIVKSKLAHILPVIQILSINQEVVFDGKAENDAKQLVKLNNAVITSLRKYISGLGDSSKSAFLSFLKEKSMISDYPPLLTVFVFASSAAITSNGELNEKCLWVENLLAFLNTFPRPEVVVDEFNPEMTDETAIQRCVHLLWKGHFPGVVVFYEFYKIVTLLNLGSPYLSSNPWLFESTNQNYKAFKILTLIFEFCVQQIKQNGATSSKLVFTNNLTNLFTAFVKYQFKKPESLFGYLSLLWSNVSGDVPVLLQVSAIETAQDSLDPLFSYNWCFENPVIFTSLLKAVSSPNVEVRKEAFSLLQSLVKICSALSCPTKSLSELVCEQQEEISIDHMHCFVVLNNWLNPAFELYGLNTSTKDAVAKAKLSVLDSFIKLLLDENIPMTMKNHLLLFLQKSDSIEILTALVPLINKSLLYFNNQNEKTTKELSDSSFELLVSKFTVRTASCLKTKCPETEALLKCLEFVVKGQATDSLIILPTLKILKREFVKAIPSVEVQKKILDVLLSACLSSTADLNTEIKRVLGKLSTYSYLILKDLQDKEISNLQSVTLREVKKLRSKEESENSNMLETRSWKKTTVLLEIIQNKSKLDKREILVQDLFNLLNKTLNHDKESSVEYLRQLILSTIYNCCQNLENERLDESQFQVEYIVQCIRSSTNPKTHYLSLLLLNLAATMFPDYVLNNVMSIFTFMGSSLVRQDDSYSFQVISQTIETIVPSLLKASKFRNENDAMQVVAAVIRVFVDSLPDIPKHRQLPLFSKLITTLDPSQYLWVPLGQICDQYAASFPEALQESGTKKFPSTLDFAVNLHKQFSPDVQMDTCISLLNFISMLPDSKDGSRKQVVQNVMEPFNVSNHSNQQLQAYKHSVLSYINVWLSSRAFVSQVSELKPKALNKLECKYEILLEKVLQYLQHLRDIEADKNEHQRSLFPLLFDLVGHINSLLPCNSFIRVVSRLLKNSEPVIQEKAIELLCCKLENQQQLFEDEESHTFLLKLLRPLLKMVEKNNENNSKEENSLSRQSALYALHLLIKVIGPEYSAKFHKVLNVTIQLLNAKTNDELTVNALLCLAQLCSSMNVQVLPQLNTFMPLIINLLNNINVMQMNDCLTLGIITALMSIVQNLGAFLSSYMSPLVSSLCDLMHKAESSNKKTVSEKLEDFQVMLSKDIDLRILLIAVEESYLEFVKTHSEAIAPLVKLLEEKLTSCSYTEIEACSNQLQQFCITLLDFRNSSTTKSYEYADAINSVELNIFSALRTFVMKLSVTHFQSFFKKVYLWATATETKLPHRLFTFYGLTNELSKSLRSLFVVVTKTFLKNAASELDTYNFAKTSSEAKESNHPFFSAHINNILDTLNHCFVNDDGHLLDKDSFDALLQPLVDQLENISDDKDAYQKRIGEHLGNCLAHFMASVSDNGLWKKLNYQILLKTRHDSPIVRFAAIQVIRDVVAVMGDNYLVLLAESIPFLAEVMEDESAEVEQECQSVIAEMEKILGEPIKKYF
ncbi:hypothetical protein JTE90_019576 [Oedothorax gibbosus]|uniref:HEAT repeat-containing protein 1 n=1 Tax=Oedothorax gibbosus TaxID=931172 RepID=A0AAV6V4V5_9ARAC|nr:hypothetical protein JTE90_019576 [Oedothorax gibbosus]